MIPLIYESIFVQRMRMVVHGVIKSKIGDPFDVLKYVKRTALPPSAFISSGCRPIIIKANALKRRDFTLYASFIIPKIAAQFIF